MHWRGHWSHVRVSEYGQEVQYEEEGSRSSKKSVRVEPYWGRVTLTNDALFLNSRLFSDLYLSSCQRSPIPEDRKGIINWMLKAHNAQETSATATGYFAVSRYSVRDSVSLSNTFVFVVGFEAFVSHVLHKAHVCNLLNRTRLNCLHR